MEKFTNISESVEFKGRGSLKSILSQIIKGFNLYEENKDFFNDYLVYYIGDEKHDEYFADLSDRQGLGQFYKEDFKYEDLRKYVYDKYDKNIDNMGSVFLEVVYLNEMLDKIESDSRKSVQDINK